MITRTLMGLAATLLLGGTAIAAEPASCKTVRFSDVGWTDITATTALTSVVLEGLGYAPKADILSVPVTYQSLKNGDIDVFLGNWMPTMEADIAPYKEDGSVETVRANLEGAKYTLAVPPTSPTRASRTTTTSPSSRTSSAARSTASSPATTATG